MIWLFWNLIKAPVRLVYGTVAIGAKTGYLTGRLLGFRRILVFGLGVAVGLLIAPVPGAKLREKLKARLADLEPDPAEAVRDRLRHDPRTWHLPEPDVEVIGGRVVLRGSAPHETGRADLEAVAGAVEGITHVDNRTDIADVV